jgi:hypothetical protein
MAMCLMCQRWTPEEVLDRHRESVERHGWSIVAVERDHAIGSFAYTVGLNQYQRHPELLVSGLDPAEAASLLNMLGDEVSDGTRFEAGRLITTDVPQRFQLVRVNNPRRLVHAQHLYAEERGLIPALQVVWSDAAGRWPRTTGRSGVRGAQPLFGKLQHR